MMVTGLACRLPPPLRLSIALAVVLCLAAALVLGNTVSPQPGTFDQVSYDALAQRVATGHGFSFATDSWPSTRAGEPTAHWSFLYTGFLAAVYALFGHQPLIARLIQAAAVGILLPWGLYRLGTRALNRDVGLWAAFLAAIYAYFAYYSGALMTEAFTITALVWMLVLCIDLLTSSNPRRWLVFGLLIGIMALLRQVALVAVPFLALWLLYCRPTRRTVGGLALAAVVSVAVILPFTIRNYRAFGRFVPINTNAGYAFFWANHPIHGRDFQGIFPADWPTYQELVPEELRPLDEAALNDALMARALSFVRDDPARYVLLSASRVEDYFKLWPAGDSAGVSNLSRVLSFGILLPFMLYGLNRAWDRRATAAPLYLFVAIYTIVHLLSWSLIRYRLPVDAVLLVFAAVTVDLLVRRSLPVVSRKEPVTA